MQIYISPFTYQRNKDNVPRFQADCSKNLFDNITSYFQYLDPGSNHTLTVEKIYQHYAVMATLNIKGHSVRVNISPEMYTMPLKDIHFEDETIYVTGRLR
jgi:hypothetical protein